MQIRQLEIQRPLSELAYEALIEAICSGDLRPHQRLTQDDLAASLKVSRLPVGQALARLKNEGFVCDAGRRGLKVAPLEADFVRQAYEFRSGMDETSARLAAMHAGEAARARGETILKAGTEATAAGDVPALIDADMRFHWFIYELTGNRLIQDAMAIHLNHIRRIMLHILREPRNQTAVWREHAAVLEAICAGDAELAGSRARGHVDHAADWLASAAAEP